MSLLAKYDTSFPSPIFSMLIILTLLSLDARRQVREIGPDADTFKMTEGGRFGVSAIQFNTPNAMARPDELFITKPDTIDISMSTYKVSDDATSTGVSVISTRISLHRYLLPRTQVRANHIPHGAGMRPKTHDRRTHSSRAGNCVPE